MRRILLAIMLLAGATYSLAQTASSNKAGGRIEAAVTYTPTYAKVSNTSCGCFWFQGGAVNVSIPVRANLSLAFNVTGQHATGLSGGTSLDRIAYLAGPRMTFKVPGWHPETHKSMLFVEALAGAVQGFNGAFPGNSVAKTSASSYAFQVGGGLDVALHHGFGLRLIEADYARSVLPDNGSDTQNDLRLASGVYLRLGKH